LDYTQNSNHFGPIDLIRPKSKKKGMPSDAPHKECPECEATVQASALICPECGYEFPPHEIKIDSMASNVALLSTQQKPEWLDVTNVSYRRHEKEGKPPSMQVSYQTGLTFHREWICLEHSGFPRTKAVQWWQKRAPACPVPNTVDEALANRTALAVPQRILVKPDGKWTQIVGVGF
jgi:DNA repair protein RadD